MSEKKKAAKKVTKSAAKKVAKKVVPFNPYKEFMEKHGITQEQLANELGLSRLILNQDLNEQKNLVRIEFGLWKLTHPETLIRESSMFKIEGRPKDTCLVCRDYDNKRVNVRIKRYDNRFRNGDYLLGFPVAVGSAYHLVGKYTNKGRLIWEKPVSGEVVNRMKTADIKITDQQRDK